MGEWQPIETAPKDGTLIIVTTGELTGVARWTVIASRDTLNDYDDGSGPRAVFAREYGWRSASDKRIAAATLTHWMEIPPRPAVKDAS
ncbi:hypothetical protein [Sphingomonas koreensis]